MKHKWLLLRLCGLIFVLGSSIGYSATMIQTPAPLKEYVIKKDDTLWDIATVFLGDPLRWQELLKFNSVNNPNLIFPGDHLFVPEVKVLDQIEEKNPDEIRSIREEMIQSAPPVSVEMPAGEFTSASSNTVTRDENIKKEEPLKTPTFKVTGSKSINISYSESRGVTGTGVTNTGYDRHESLRLSMEGQLHEKVKIQGNFAQSDLSDEDQYDLTLSTKRWEAYFGDFGATLPGSQYLSSGMSSSGVKVRSLYDNWNISTLYGTPRGRTIYEKYYGNRTQGPYLIQGTPLVAGTEIIWLNKQKQIRGVDYEFDATIGRLLFKNRTIDLTDLIEVQVQTRGASFDSQVYGYRVGGGFGGETKKTLTLGQGYLRQYESPDPAVTTITGKAATDTHMLEMDALWDLGPPLKIGLEGAYSFLESADVSLTPKRRGGAYQANADTFQGPFHFGGNYARTETGFNSIGNPLSSNDYREWKGMADYKPGAGFYAAADRGFRKTMATGFDNETTTDHGECRVFPKSWPELEYVYYRNADETKDPAQPVSQENQRHKGDVKFGLPGKLSLTTGGEQEERTGNLIQDIRSRSANAVLSSNGWTYFNFNCSGTWKLNDVMEESTNTNTPHSDPGNSIPSQIYTLSMEGKPVKHLVLSGRGNYSSDPPGLPQANAAGSFSSDPVKWLTTSGNYSLEFQQIQMASNTTPSRIHTGSGSIELTPLGWLRINAQPTFRLEILPDYDHKTSESSRQYYQASLSPKIGSMSMDYSMDRYLSWDYQTATFPLNYSQNTENYGSTASKPIGSTVNIDAGYRRSDQKQETFGSVTTKKRTVTQYENDGLTWNASKIFTFLLGHSYSQLRQDSPGQGMIDNPLLPYGSDTFNTSYSTNSLNIFTKAHTYSLRSTEQISSLLSIYQEGGYTWTRDVLRMGLTETYSPATGFSWKPITTLNWTGSYQYNGSKGQVQTSIQRANTTLSANINQSTNVSINWAWNKVLRPSLTSQQGNMAFTMSF